jgi:hypothetical protein
VIQSPWKRRRPRHQIKWPEKIEVGQLYFNWKFQGNCFIGVYRGTGQVHCFKFLNRADATAFRSQSPIVSAANVHTWDEALVWLKQQQA